jgi:hypothetical protein
MNVQIEAKLASSRMGEGNQLSSIEQDKTKFTHLSTRIMLLYSWFSTTHRAVK